MFKDLYPFKSHYLDLQGLQYHYLDEGQGEPVVMVHGNPTWSFYYRNLARALSNNAFVKSRVIVPDHIGCGFSSTPDDSRYDYTLKQRIDDLETLLETLKLRENITLVLHDWGGMIGMGYATRHPERISKIVLLNTAAFHLPPGKGFPAALRLTRTWLGALAVRGFNAFSAVAARVCVKRKPMSKEILRGYVMPYDSWKNRIATLRFVQDIPLQPGDVSYDEVSRIESQLQLFRKIPVQIYWGKLDFVFDDHFLARWKEIFPQAEVHYFADCGHYILEDAAEEIIPLIQSFVTKQENTFIANSLVTEP